MKNWNAERTNLFRAEMTKLFLAFNKPMNKTTIDAKTELTAETLETLSTEKITEFFTYVRRTEDVLPNDGVLKRILIGNHLRFSKQRPEIKQIATSKAELPDEKWLKQFTSKVNAVIDGTITPDEAKASLGL